MAYSTDQHYVLAGLESTKGTSVTPNKDLGIVIGDGIGLTREIKEIESISSVVTQQIVTGMVEVSGNMDVEVTNGRLLYMLLGGVAHDATDTPDIKHTFSVADLSTFTLGTGEDGSTDVTLDAAGSMLESVEFSIELNGVLTASTNFKGMDLESGTTAETAQISSLAVFPHSMSTLSIDSTTVDFVQSLSITITNTVVPLGGLGSNKAQDIRRTGLKVAFSGQMGFSAKTYQELAMGGTSLASGDPTSFSLDFKVSNGVAAGSGLREIQIAVDNCQNDSFEKVAAVGEYVFYNFSGVGILDAANTYSYDNITSANWF